MTAQPSADTGVVLPFTIYGPSLPSPQMTEAVEVTWSQFERSVYDLHGFIQHNHQIPNAVWLGSQNVPPEAFLVAMAKIARKGANGGAPPERVMVAPARLATEKYVAVDSLEIWSWPIFRRDFIPNICWSWHACRRGPSNLRSGASSPKSSGAISVDAS